MVVGKHVVTIVNWYGMGKWWNESNNTTGCSGCWSQTMPTKSNKSSKQMGILTGVGANMNELCPDQCSFPDSEKTTNGSVAHSPYIYIHTYICASLVWVLGWLSMTIYNYLRYQQIRYHSDPSHWGVGWDPLGSRRGAPGPWACHSPWVESKHEGTYWCYEYHGFQYRVVSLTLCFSKNRWNSREDHNIEEMIRSWHTGIWRLSQAKKKLISGDLDFTLPS